MDLEQIPENRAQLARFDAHHANKLGLVQIDGSVGVKTEEPEIPAGKDKSMLKGGWKLSFNAKLIFNPLPEAMHLNISIDYNFDTKVVPLHCYFLVFFGLNMPCIQDFGFTATSNRTFKDVWGVSGLDISPKLLSWSLQQGLSFKGDAVWRTSSSDIPMSLYVEIGITRMKLVVTVTISEKKIFEIATSAMGLSGGFLDFALSDKPSKYELIVTKDPVAACAPASPGHYPPSHGLLDSRSASLNSLSLLLCVSPCPDRACAAPTALLGSWNKRSPQRSSSFSSP